MVSWLFTRRFNLFDGTFISIAAGGFRAGHPLIALAVCLIGAMCSCLGEELLDRRTREAA